MVNGLITTYANAISVIRHIKLKKEVVTLLFGPGKRLNNLLLLTQLIIDIEFVRFTSREMRSLVGAITQHQPSFLSR